MRILLVTFLSFIIYSSLYAQKNDIQITREVILTNGDSLVIIEVLTSKSHRFNPEQNKIYYWYKRDKISSNQGGFSGILIHGKYQVFLNENLIESGQFSQGLKTGVWRRWTKSGSLISSHTWDNGIKHGDFFIYSPVIKSLTKGRYHKGMLHGRIMVSVNDTTYYKKYNKGIELPFKKPLFQTSISLTPKDTVAGSNVKDMSN